MLFLVSTIAKVLAVSHGTKHKHPLRHTVPNPLLVLYQIDVHSSTRYCSTSIDTADSRVSKRL